MEDHALFDFTPTFCPDCGEDWSSLYKNKLSWMDYRSGIPHHCLECGLSFYFVRDLETIIMRIQDEKV